MNLGTWGRFNPSKGTISFKRGLAVEDFDVTVSSAYPIAYWDIKQNMFSQTPILDLNFTVI